MSSVNTYLTVFGEIMNKVILLGTATAMLATTPFAAASGSIDGKLYGKINVSVVNSDSGSEDTWKLNSNASRIGLKGSNQVSEGLTVFYKTEFQVEVDGDGDVFKQRNIYAGIKGQYGSLLAGKNHTPTKLAQKKIDLFNDLEGDIMKTFAGENPVSNIIAYTTPKYGNFSATYAVMPSEANNGGLSDATSYSVNYSKGDLYVAIAGNSNVADIDLVRVDLVRVVSQFKVDAWQLGLMYQDNDTTDESGYFASAAYKSNNIIYKGQYGSNEKDIDGSDKTTLSVGADLKLAKNTKTFVFFTDNESSSSTKTFGLGLEHKF